MTRPLTKTSNQSRRVEPRLPIRLEGFAYGGDYNPDQWPEAVWEADVRLMREAGVNLVSLPVFGWSRIEPSPGEFDFAWLDEIIDLLWANGVSVALATATATPPPWMVRQHPEMLPVDADGVRLEFGSRQSYCPSSPTWREACSRMAAVMAARYGQHPAIVLWHVSNEYGDHVAACYCDESAHDFRLWLRRRYQTIDRLNQGWGTAVWGQIYRDWNEIFPPRRAPGPINPAQVLDFKRFSSDALLELFRLEVDVLREVTPEIPVTTNFMSLFHDLDYWKFADLEDVVTDDAYPDPAAPSIESAALNYSLMRGLKGGQPWILLEQAPSAVSWRPVNVPKAPGQMRLMSLQAVAHGADGVMCFQWRQARFGPERFHSAMLGHREHASRTFREAVAFGAELARLEPVIGTSVRSSVALVVDWDSWWASSAPDSMPSDRLRWLDQAQLWSAALRSLGHTVDVVRADGASARSAEAGESAFVGPFGPYSVVVVPGLYLVDPASAAAMEAYVEQGGHLVIGPFSGVVDPNEHVFVGGAPGPLRDLLGVEVDEFWPIAEGRQFQIETTDRRVLLAETWAEWLETNDATQVLASFVDGPLAGRPAITEQRRGTGSATYIGAVLSLPDLISTLARPLASAGIAPSATPSVDSSQIEIVTRSDGARDFTFVLNHADTSAAVNVDIDVEDLLSGNNVSGSVELAPFGALVLAHGRSLRRPVSEISELTSQQAPETNPQSSHGGVE